MATVVATPTGKDGTTTVAAAAAAEEVAMEVTGAAAVAAAVAVEVVVVAAEAGVEDELDEYSVDSLPPSHHRTQLVQKRTTRHDTTQQ